MGAKKTKKANKSINLNDCLVLNKYFLSLFGKRDFRELAEDMRSADLEGYNEENTSYFHEFIVRKYVKLGFLNKDKLKEYDENIFRYVQHIGEGRGGLPSNISSILLSFYRDISRTVLPGQGELCCRFK